MEWLQCCFCDIPRISSGSRCAGQTAPSNCWSCARTRTLPGPKDSDFAANSQMTGCILEKEEVTRTHRKPCLCYPHVDKIRYHFGLFDWKLLLLIGFCLEGRCTVKINPVPFSKQASESQRLYAHSRIHGWQCNGG